MTKAQDEAIAKIAKKFQDRMKAQGMDVTGAGPGKDGTPTIKHLRSYRGVRLSPRVRL